MAAAIGADFGYDEINLNVGCPSDRVQEGRFGACLMAEPELVADCVAAMQARVVDAVRRRDAAIEQEHGPGAVWVAVSHGDLVKAVLADALGMHLDLFQRISVDPASVSVVRYAPLRPFAVRVNDTGGDVTALLPPPPSTDADDQPASSDAVVGGGAGGGAGG